MKGIGIPFFLISLFCHGALFWFCCFHKLGPITGISKKPQMHNLNFTFQTFCLSSS